MADKGISVEESFRSNLEDLVVILDKLSPHCQSVGDLLGMLSLAIENEGQLRLLISIVTSTKK